MLILEKDDGRQSVALARYFIGYGLHLGESVTVYDTSVVNWKHLFPKPMEKKKLSKIGDLKKEIDKVGNTQPEQNRLEVQHSRTCF
jgi:hypothetical protein